MPKKLYKLKYTLYQCENSEEIRDWKDDDCELFAKKGQLAELVKLEEDEYEFWEGETYKYILMFKNGRYLYSHEKVDMDWFDEVIR